MISVPARKAAKLKSGALSVAELQPDERNEYIAGKTAEATVYSGCLILLAYIGGETGSSGRVPIDAGIFPLSPFACTSYQEYPNRRSDISLGCRCHLFRSVYLLPAKVLTRGSSPLVIQRTPDESKQLKHDTTCLLISLHNKSVQIPQVKCQKHLPSSIS